MNVDPITNSTQAAQPPLGVSREINNYLNHYITVADAKAAAFLAASLAVAAAMIGDESIKGCCAALKYSSLFFFALSAIIATFVIFPRLPRGYHGGLIFWEDIRERSTVDQYISDFLAADEKEIEKQFASQNYYVSQVLHHKNRLIRWCIVVFTIGLAVAAAVYLKYSHP